MFHFPGLASAAYVFSDGWQGITPPGFPIRKSTDQSLFSGSPWLIAATHVLLRLLLPRHPPCALCSLVTNSFPVVYRQSRCDEQDRNRGPGRLLPTQTSCNNVILDIYPQDAAVEIPKRIRISKNRSLRDPMKTSVELIGFEPTTSSLQSWRSPT